MRVKHDALPEALTGRFDDRRIVKYRGKFKALAAGVPAVVLLVIGAVFWLVDKIGRPVAGRRSWY